MKYFSIDSQGNKLRGFVMKPKGKGPFKTVIVSHGFGENQALTHSYAKVFVKKVTVPSFTTSRQPATASRAVRPRP